MMHITLLLVLFLRFPEFYWSISEPVSFETVIYKLNRKAYSCFEEFDYDVLRAFLVTQVSC